MSLLESMERSLFFSEFIVEKGKSSGICACELQILLCQQKAILKLLLT